MVVLQVIKPRLARPGRVAVTTCAWGLDGKCVAGGLGNGSVQVCAHTGSLTSSLRKIIF